MRIERKPYPEMTLEAFADQHGLVMVIEERAMDSWQHGRRLERYMARFKGVEIGRDGILSGAYGNGHSEAEAIEDYRKQISLQLLIQDAWKDTRREIRAPRLVA